MGFTVNFIHNSLRDCLWSEAIWETWQSAPEKRLIPPDGVAPIFEYARSTQLALQHTCERGSTRDTIALFAKIHSDAVVYPNRHRMYWFCDYAEHALIDDLYERGLLNQQEAQHAIQEALNDEMIHPHAKERLVIMRARIVGVTSEEFFAVASDWKKFRAGAWILHPIAAGLAHACIEHAASGEYRQAEDKFRLMLSIADTFVDHLAEQLEGSQQHLEMECALFTIVGQFADIDEESRQFLLNQSIRFGHPIFPIEIYATSPGQTQEQLWAQLEQLWAQLNPLSWRKTHEGQMRILDRRPFLPLSEEAAHEGIRWGKRLLGCCHYPLSLLLLSKYLTKLSEWCPTALVCETASSISALWGNYRQGQGKYVRGLEDINRGMLRFARLSFLDAIEDLEKVTDTVPSLVQAQIDLGNACYMVFVTHRDEASFDRDAAIPHLNRAEHCFHEAVRKGDNVEQHLAHLGLAGVWLQSYSVNDQDEIYLGKMKHSLENAVACGTKLRPGGVKNSLIQRYRQLAEIYEARGQFDDAHECHQRLRELNSSSSDVAEGLTASPTR